MRIRRCYAEKILCNCSDVWPILESAAQVPEGWEGWPEKKSFAFVLTHDVENETGLGRVRDLAELEMELGLRSSFNFIPEGGYKVPQELREWLVGNGFEVGVHDLYHDGNLYDSRERFRERAERINTYLASWGAVGFRSGFMLRQLEWLHDLNIAYDASTFDTDPFEPQPDGVGTIFPFWVSTDSAENTEISQGRGYVELPYTLPQDSTLFRLLRYSNIDIWKKKHEWVVENGGMSLLNVHPDYLCFEGDSLTDDKFPVQWYRDFLEYVKDHQFGRGWHALPREVAEFYALRNSVVSADDSLADEGCRESAATG